VDSGCTGAIINLEFVFQHKLPRVKRAEPVRVTGADGTPIEGAGVKYTTPLTMRIGHHQEESFGGEATPANPIVYRSQCERRCEISSNYCEKLKFGKLRPRPRLKAVLGGKVAGARKANSGPAGEAAGAEESGPAGKAAGAEIEWHDEEGGNIANRLPKIYRKWASVFNEEEINRLPDNTEYDHRIELVEGAVPPFGPIYPLSEKSCKRSESISEKSCKRSESISERACGRQNPEVQISGRRANYLCSKARG
jgi:hypothetical protein